MREEIREMRVSDFFRVHSIKFDHETAPYFGDTVFTPRNISWIGHFYRKANLFLSLLLKKSLIDYYVVLALVNRKPVGVCWITITRENNRKKGTLGIFVNKSFRGKGLGTKMLKKMVNHADRMNIRLFLLVYEENKGAAYLYKKMGFKKKKVLLEMER